MLRTLGVISMANWFYVAGSLCFLIGTLILIELNPDYVEMAKRRCNVV